MGIGKIGIYGDVVVTLIAPVIPLLIGSNNNGIPKTNPVHNSKPPDVCCRASRLSVDYGTSSFDMLSKMLELNAKLSKNLKSTYYLNIGESDEYEVHTNKPQHTRVRKHVDDKYSILQTET